MKNERGITLIELLAVLTLLGIISIAVYNFIFTTYRAEETTRQKINLTTEANLIIAQLEKEFYTQDEIELIIENGTLISAHTGELHGPQVQVDAEETTINGKKLVSKTSFKTADGFEIRLKLINEKNKEHTLTIESSFSRFKLSEKNDKDENK